MIQLENGLTACLISDQSPLDNDCDDDDEDIEWETSESELSEAESAEDTDESDGKKPPEQKMVFYSKIIKLIKFVL